MGRYSAIEAPARRYGKNNAINNLGFSVEIKNASFIFPCSKFNTKVSATLHCPSKQSTNAFAAHSWEMANCGSDLESKVTKYTNMHIFFDDDIKNAYEAKCPHFVDCIANNTYNFFGRIFATLYVFEYFDKFMYMNLKQILEHALDLPKMLSSACIHWKNDRG